MKSYLKLGSAFAVLFLLAGTAIGSDALATGTIKGVDADKGDFVLTDSAGKDVTLKLDDKVVVNRGGTKSKSDLKAGDPVNVRYDKGLVTSTAKYILVQERPHDLGRHQTHSLRQNNEKGATMKGFVQDIEGIAIKNEDFRQVVYTAKNCQLVVMALKPKEEIGAEVHKLDQFFRVEEGSGEAVLNGVRTPIRAGFAVLVPAGMNHNIINTGSAPLKLYTLYATPNHRDGVVHHTRAEAEADNEHFDGKTTE